MFSFLRKTIRFFKETYFFSQTVWRDNRDRKGQNADLRIAINGFPGGFTSQWFRDAIAERTQRQVEFSWYKPSLILTSLFGSCWLLKIILLTYKQPSVFFSGENIRTLKKYRDYRNYLNDLPTVALGFDYCEKSNYKRFPLWLLYIFPAAFVAKASIADIQGRLDQIERQSFLPKQKFAAMIASHAGYFTSRKIDGNTPMVSRTIIAQQLQKIQFVHCPGKLLHNDVSLKEEFADNKKKYLQQFHFNICSENAASPGYVTEKLFESFEAGAIPVYWGDENPEPAILNHERILFWSNNSDNTETLDRIEKLYLSSTERQNFLTIPIFKQTAARAIYGYFGILNSNLIQLLPTALQNGSK
ncbi:MAG: glycosyltransferase family 10 [Desulforhopalus sp.]